MVGSVFSFDAYTDTGAMLILAGVLAIPCWLAWRWKGRRARKPCEGDGLLSAPHPSGSPDLPTAQPLDGSSRSSAFFDEALDQAGGEFRIGLLATVGEELQLLDSSDQEKWWRLGALDRRERRYELVAQSGLAALIYIEGYVPRMTCKEGSWLLRKQGTRGWNFVIESEDGRSAGSYQGRRWRPGGDIQLSDETRIELRYAPRSYWDLTLAGERESFVELRVRRPKARDRERMTLTLRSLPPAVSDVHVAMLTAVSVIILEGLLAPTVPAG